MTGRELVLGVAAVAFAATSVWLAMELKAERAKSAALSNTGIAEPYLAESQQIPTRTNSIAATVTAEDESLSPSSNQGDHASRAEALRKLLDDPQQRQAFFQEGRSSVRHSYPELARQLHLSAPETEALIDILAQHNLRAATISANCRGDLECWLAAAREDSAPRRAELEAFLGTEKLERFEQYRDSLPERRTVRQFQVMLPLEHALTDADAERLISEMAQERRDTTAAAQARGENASSFGTIFGDVLTRQGVDAQERYELGEQYSQRLRARAGRILTPEQFDAFSRMQDDLLASMRSMIDQNVR